MLWGVVDRAAVRTMCGVKLDVMKKVEHNSNIERV